MWDLPIAVHELGHHVGVGLETDKVLDPLFDAAKSDYRAQRWIHEHLADIFATYTLGPAYACTCLLAPLDPTTDPDRGDRYHPSDAMRPTASCAFWNGSIAPTGSGGKCRASLYSSQTAGTRRRPPPVPARGSAPPTSSSLKGGWMPFMTRSIASIPSRRYNSRYEAGHRHWPRAQGLKQRLFSPSNPASATPANTHTITDVLNAAWLARLDAGLLELSDRQLSDRAFAACLARVRRRGRSG